MSEIGQLLEQQLKEMGFDEEKVKRALKSNPQSLEAAMDWIIAHGDDEPDELEQEAMVAQDTSSPPVERTPEEREAQLKRLEELRKLKAKEREERERQEAIEFEKSRRKTGGEIRELREKHDANERLRMAEERKKDKDDDRMHRQKILDQIKADREAHKRKLEGKPAVEVSTNKPLVPAAQPKTETDQCKLAIRLPDGSSIMHSFQSKEPLQAVRVFVTLNRKDMSSESLEAGNITFKLPPTTTFSEEDMERPLTELGLCPSSRLVVVQRKAILSYE